MSAPPIDTRSVADIAGQVAAGVRRYTGWQPAGADPGTALVHVFAHLMGIAIDRLNRAPDKALLAFLDMLGLEPAPPLPARAALTFRLASGSKADARVPAGTAVGATPLPGDPAPVVFTTEQDLVVTRSVLSHVLTREPARDLYADHGAASAAYPAFAGDTAMRRRLFLGSDGRLAASMVKTVSVALAVEHADAAALAALSWGWWDGAAIRPLPVLSSTVVGSDWTIVLGDVPAVPLTSLSGLGKTWLVAELPGGTLCLPPLGQQAAALPLGQQAAALPVLNSASLQLAVKRSAAPDIAFSNDQRLDPTRDFLPFGARPALGAALLLSSAAFSRPSPAGRLNVRLVVAPSPLGSAKPDPQTPVELTWEYQTAQGWSLLGRSVVPPTAAAAADNETNQFKDATNAFTATTPQPVAFTAPADWLPGMQAGESGWWLRVRITAGGYGHEARYDLVSAGGAPPVATLVPSTLRPPAIAALTVESDFVLPMAPFDAVQAENELSVRPLALPGTPFLRAPEGGATLYLGFARPGDATGFAVGDTTLYLGVTPPAYEAAAAPPPVLAWEYWAGGQWSPLDAVDGSHGLTRPGLLAFLGPPDFTVGTVLGRRAFWLRGRCTSPAPPGSGAGPMLARIATNTVWARHAMPVVAEVLGTGNTEPGQSFTTIRTPVLAGEQVMVREPERPNPADLAALQAALGGEVLRVVAAAGGRPEQVWVAWEGLPDFQAADATRRCYSLDRLSGRIRFGDGLQGRIPPAIPGGISISYASGGGAVGNRSAGSITQVKTALASIDGVTNAEPSAGGADAEGEASLLARGPATLRHRDRAVALADFEDLAHAASAEVARARAIPLAPGGVALVIAGGGSARPAPTQALVSLVDDYVRARLTPTASLLVRGPAWLAIDTRVEAVPAAGVPADTVRSQVLAGLAAFLHPLTGGPASSGWPFGARPHRSDLIALIEDMPAIDFVRLLAVSEVGDAPQTGLAAPDTGLAAPDTSLAAPDTSQAALGEDPLLLIYSGTHQVDIVAAELDAASAAPGGS